MLSLDRFLVPLFPSLQRFNRHFRAHAGMANSAKLRTDDLVGAGSNWSKPHRHFRARSRILSGAHIVERKAMNDVLGSNFDDGRLVVHEMEIVLRKDVVAAGRIVWIQSDGILAGHKVRRDFTED